MKCIFFEIEAPMKSLPPDSLSNPVLPEHLIRERAYFRWLDVGRPDGDDQAHWFWAREQIAAGSFATDHRSAPESSSSAHASIQPALANGLSDPTHRFHDPQRARDARLDVVAGEARQRVRGRHLDSSLRAQPKKAAH